MEEKRIDATPQRPGDGRITDAPVVTIDVPAFMEQVKQEPPWRNSDRNAITIFKTEKLSIVLVALHKGAEMNRDAAHGIFTLQVLEGEIQCNADEQTANLHKGQIVVIHEPLLHKLKAARESVFLLTLTTG